MLSLLLAKNIFPGQVLRKKSGDHKAYPIFPLGWYRHPDLFDIVDHGLQKIAAQESSARHCLVRTHTALSVFVFVFAMKDVS